MKKTVAIAMSGGVDSSVAALLLKEMGYDVVGTTMRIWECDEENQNSKNKKVLCCSLRDMEDAKKVANKLNIPHYVIDFRTYFDKYVVKYFCEQYADGYTPNPCIICNKKIKFGILLDKIKSMGMDYLATGHYARIEFSNSQYLLKRSKDRTIDQSYWLYNLTQEQMKYVLLPLSEYTKSEVRHLAKKNSLPVADKPKSQEICFIQNNNYHEFIVSKDTGDYKCVIPGNIIDIRGNYLGKHKGIVFYTIGQRKGLGICTEKPVYVISIDSKTNTIVVDEEKYCYRKQLIADDVNFIVNSINFPIRTTAKIRYKHEETDSTVYKQGKDSIEVKFKEPQWAITPGQSVVFYQGETVLGGGIIKKNDNNN